MHSSQHPRAARRHRRHALIAVAPRSRQPTTDAAFAPCQCAHTRRRSNPAARRTDHAEFLEAPHGSAACRSPSHPTAAGASVHASNTPATITATTNTDSTSTSTSSDATERPVAGPSGGQTRLRAAAPRGGVPLPRPQGAQLLPPPHPTLPYPPSLTSSPFPSTRPPERRSVTS